ncbi:MAG: CAP domain-containing protein [Hyphomicrobiaceae bacterium]|nr:CAP domain-containing protein [Hyphomicrobiaceae bacterium]
MYRFVVTGLVGFAVAGCALNSSSISSGFADNNSLPTASIARPKRGSAALGGDPGARSSVAGQRYAKLDDRAPSGTYETAPSGALADRDYSSTRLNVEFARDIINQYRKDNGLKPLKLNAELTEAAKAHSRDLAKWDRISHYGSDGSNPWDRVKRTGFKARLAAENVGTGQVTFEEVMKGWRNSPGHNKNLLLADAEQMGLALVYDPKTEFKSFWTLVLGSSM